MAPAGTNPKIEELKSKLKTDPKSRLFYPLAEELRKAGQFAEAEQVLRTGLMNHSTYLSAWVVLGRVLREQQKHGDAVGVLSKALELDRGNVVAARLLAESYLALGERVEAVKKYKLVHALLPGDEETEAVIQKLEAEIKGSAPGAVPVEATAPAASAAPATPPAPVPAEPESVSAPASAPDADPFEVTYSRLKKESSESNIPLETADTEPMRALHDQSPFEEPAAQDGYSSDAYAIEQPAGMHITEAPEPAGNAAEEEGDFQLDQPLPEMGSEEAEVFEPTSEIAPGFIQGSFDANVPPPAPAAEDFSKTITMADLYANQGLVDEARDIYEDVLARDPGNESVRRKLDALAEMTAAPAEEEPGEQFAGEEAPDLASPQPAAASTGMDPISSSEQDGRVKRLEDWLTRVRRTGVRVFRQTLEEIHSRIDGALAVSLIGLDGIAIEAVKNPDVPLDVLGAEFGGFIRSIRLSNTDLNTGEVLQFSLVTEKYVTFLSAVTGDYFILLVMSPDGNYGRARFELARAKHVLRDELA